MITFNVMDVLSWYVLILYSIVALAYTKTIYDGEGGILSGILTIIPVVVLALLQIKGY